MSEDVDSENVPKSSEAIIADLLNDVKASEKPFSVEKLAGCDEGATEKSKKKHHKSRHRSKKSKKDRRRSHSRSDSSRSRSRSRERNRKRKRRSRSRSKSSTRNDRKKEKTVRKSEVIVTSLIAESTQPAAEPVQPEMPAADFKPFRLKEEEDELTLGADFQTKILKKEEKKMEISITTVLPKVEDEKFEIDKQREMEEGELEDIVYGCETISREADEQKEQTVDQIVDESKLGEEKKEKKIKEKSKKKKKEKKEERKRKTSPTEKSKRRASDEKTSSSRRRSRSKDRDSRRRSHSPRRRSRSPVPRGRGEIRINRRSASRDRRDWDLKRRSSNQKDYEEYRRRRSRSREFIDKEKLLEIAKSKRAEMMSNGDRGSASIEDFVVYCKKLQKRQEREKRREAGQAVSDHDSDTETPRFKHPYALPKDPIRINIITATSNSLAQKAIMAPEEPTQLNASQLRIVFPVSSGAVHKENAEWIPVEKNDVPKSCTTEQKKHVALTSLEIDRCRAQGIPIAPVAIPKFLDSILPPPPPPPQFMPNLNDPYRPPTPPPLPSLLYVPHKEKMIIREPTQISVPAPNDISATLKQRTAAQKKLYSTPNDFEAHRELREANEKIELWAALKSLPGEYTGTTGLKLLTADELQPHNPKYHAWVKRDQFKNAAPATGGIGKLMMEKMGWRPGEGLGKDASGNVEPLVLDVKSDRRGLQAEEEMSTKQRNKLNAQNNVPLDLSTKNPISLIMELCAKRRWPNPAFTCEDSGQDHLKMFVWTVVINNVSYRPMCGSKQKKEGKAVAAQVALQSLGVLPRDPDLPVFI